MRRVNLKQASYDWDHLLKLGRSTNEHERRSASISAQNKFEQFFQTNNIPLQNGKLMDGVLLLVERDILTDAKLFLQLKSAIDVRNQITHRDGIPSQDEAVQMISAYRNFLYQQSSASVKPNTQKSTNAAVHTRVSSDENRPLIVRPEESSTNSLNVLPPASVSYHPAIYIHREDEEKRALSCLLHPNNPLIIQAPALFGKRAFVDNILKRLSREASISVIRIDGSKIGSLEDFRNQCHPECELKELDVHIILKQRLALTKSLLILIINNADTTEFVKLGIIQTIRQLSERNEQPWTRMRLLCTFSSSWQELKSNNIFDKYQSILLEEFNYAQVEELAARHKLSDTNIDDLWHLVGGHPYLVRLGLFQALIQNISLSQLILDDDVFARHKEAVIQTLMEQYFISLDTQRILQEALKPLKEGKALLPSSVTLELYKQGLLRQANNGYQPRCLLYKELLIRLAIDNNFSITTQEQDIKDAQEAEAQMLTAEREEEEIRRLEAAKQREVRSLAKLKIEETEADRLTKIEQLADARMASDARRKRRLPKTTGKKETNRLEALKRIEEFFKRVQKPKKQGFIYQSAPQNTIISQVADSLYPQNTISQEKTTERKKKNIGNYIVTISTALLKLTGNKQHLKVSPSESQIFTDDDLKYLENLKSTDGGYITIGTNASGARVFYGTICIPRFSIQFYMKSYRLHLKILESNNEIKMNGIPLDNRKSHRLTDEAEYTIDSGGSSSSVFCLSITVQ